MEITTQDNSELVDTALQAQLQEASQLAENQLPDASELVDGSGLTEGAELVDGSLPEGSESATTTTSGHRSKSKRTTSK